MAAFQALGGFISTFADPNLSGIYMNEEGEVIALQRFDMFTGNFYQPSNEIGAGGIGDTSDVRLVIIIDFNICNIHGILCKIGRPLL